MAQTDLEEADLNQREGRGGCFALDWFPPSLYRSPLVELSGDGYMRRDGVEWGKWGHAQREKSSLLLLI